MRRAHTPHFLTIQHRNSSLSAMAAKRIWSSRATSIRIAAIHLLSTCHIAALSTSPWKSASWKLILNIGSHPGVSDENLPEASWGASGARLSFPIELQVKADPVPEKQQDALLGGRGANQLKIVMSDDDPSGSGTYITDQGQQRVPLQAETGGWKLRLGRKKGHASMLQFWLDLGGKKDKIVAQKKDVTLCGKERLYFAAHCWRETDYQIGKQNLQPVLKEYEFAQSKLEEKVDHDSGDRRLDGTDALETLSAYKDMAGLTLDRDNKWRQLQEAQEYLPPPEELPLGHWPGDTEPMAIKPMELFVKKSKGLFGTQEEFRLIGSWEARPMREEEEDNEEWEYYNDEEDKDNALDVSPSESTEGTSSSLMAALLRSGAFKRQVYSSSQSNQQHPTSALRRILNNMQGRRTSLTSLRAHSTDVSSPSSTLSDEDQDFLSQALDYARLGAGHTFPNPAVGCVIVEQSTQKVLGAGFHPRAGYPHAEVFALLEAAGHLDSGVAAAKDVVTGKTNKQVQALADQYSSENGPTELFGDAFTDMPVTAYVTLEPCCHYGKTPPCASSLVLSKVDCVVVGVGDPNPCVDGGGVQLLRDAGISVDIADSKAGQESAALVDEFIKRIVPKDYDVNEYSHVTGAMRRALRSIAGRGKTDGSMVQVNWNGKVKASNEEEVDNLELPAEWMEHLDGQLWKKELINLRLNKAVNKKKLAKQLGERIAGTLGAHVAQNVGHTVLLYRPGIPPKLDLEKLIAESAKEEADES